MPVNLRRKDVEVTPWYPLAIRDVPISATFGFHQAMYGVLQLANNGSAPVLPMLCDITIYYSYLKMLYSYWMQPLPLHHVYSSVCPLFGIWHPYKYCVDHTYSAFLPFMVALEYEGFLQNPAPRQLYAYPSLIVKERLILAIYLSIPGIHAHLRSTASSRTLKDKLSVGLYRLAWVARSGVPVCKPKRAGSPDSAPLRRLGKLAGMLVMRPAHWGTKTPFGCTRWGTGKSSLDGAREKVPCGRASARRRQGMGDTYDGGGKTGENAGVKGGGVRNEALRGPWRCPTTRPTFPPPKTVSRHTDGLHGYEGAYRTARTVHHTVRTVRTVHRTVCAPRALFCVLSFVFSRNFQVGRDAVTSG